MQEHENLRQMGRQQHNRRAQLLSNAGKRGISDGNEGGEFIRRKRSLTTPGPAKNIRGKTINDLIMRQPPHHFDVTILPYTMQRIEKTGRKQAEMDPDAVLDHPEMQSEGEKSPSPEPVHASVIVKLNDMPPKVSKGDPSSAP
ncbi:Oidioi.mRNA.OKI2018_I69.XSR.g14774.t1.cds [Oikopleura dioica]|uniref:Oidioi.mRNA.OKI2018_I69.XSR.g14774.t1.cds n=1 Tax=Oikopleura dioica TaxID=34765 RepID=A0ABN7SI43_OIKDI|nr:Oidioi.mRNA.OKI2018_I69.XSR.g14774.t1.cds [Oikopleura dioica]